jgi:ribose transport system ATP-binding protein
VTVLRDGCHVATRQISGTTTAELVRLMADRDVAEHYPRRERRHREHDASERVSEPREPPSRCALRRPSRSGAGGERLPAAASAEAGAGESEGRSPSEDEELLNVERLHGGGLADISFTLRGGEILGIAGLVGAGRTRLARALVGADPIAERRIRVRGTPVRIDSPADAVRAGIGFLPEDRKQQGLVLRLSVERNMSLSHLAALARLGVLDRAKERGEASDAIASLRIRTPGPDQLVQNLSGGSQQKVVLAKWLAAHAAILIFDEPTRGIDVAARQEIYQLMNRLVESGAAIIMISSDLAEVLGMSDRILVMRGGRIALELGAGEATETNILQAALGVAS